MAKKTKESTLNLYNLNSEGVPHEELENEIKKKKAKEREKRIREAKEKQLNEDFDLETDAVIKMTNRNRIQKENQKIRQISKQEKKRRKKIKIIKKITKTILLLGIVIGGIIFATTSPIFYIKDIQVLNNNYVSSDTITSLSGLKKDENIFKFNKIKVINNIKQNAYMENVKISRKLPNKIEINVEERVATYSVDYMGKYAYINTQGYILEISEDSKSMPIIQGISTEENEVVEGNRLNTEDLQKLEDIIKIMDVATENNLNEKVTSIDITKKNEYSLYLESEQKRIYLGDTSNLSTKILYAMAIIEKEASKAGSVYVNGDFNNKFQAYFRESIN